MRGHGNLVVASDIPRAVHRALYTEVNAQQLAIALSFRRPIKYVQPDERQDPQRLGDSWDVWKHEAMGEKGVGAALSTRPERGTARPQRFVATRTCCGHPRLIS